MPNVVETRHQVIVQRTVAPARLLLKTLHYQRVATTLYYRAKFRQELKLHYKGISVLLYQLTEEDTSVLPVLSTMNPVPANFRPGPLYLH